MATHPQVRVLTATHHHAAILEGLVGEMPHLAGNLWHDSHTAALMKEHGVKTIVTRDSDFHRFSFLEVLDPLTQTDA